MRHIATILIMIAALSACTSRVNKNRLNFWPSAGEEADSLTMVVENCIVNGAPRDTIENLLARLDSMCPDRRAEHYRSRLLYRRNMFDSAITVLENLRATTDSAANPYLWHRVMAALGNDYPTSYDGFLLLARALDYFTAIGDSMQMASATLNLGNKLYHIKDFQRALEYIDKAQKLYSALGLEANRLRSQINRMACYWGLRDAESFEVVFNELFDSIDYLLEATDTLTADILLHNAYSMTGQHKYAVMAYNLVRDNPDYDREMMYHLSSLGGSYHELGKPDSAGIYLHQAFDLTRRYPESDYIWPVYFKYILTLAHEEKYDSAFYYSYQYIMHFDKISPNLVSVRMRDHDFQRHLAAQEVEARYRARTERFTWSIVLLSVLLLGGTAAWWLYRRSQRQKVERLRTMLDLEHSRRKVVAQMLALQEKDTLLETLRRNLSNVGTNSETTPRSAQELENMIRMHRADSEEMKGFTTAFENLSPHFLKNLKKRCPTLADNYVKLATYIYAGMSVNQIARLLNIRPQSVHQSRWRLKRMLGIEDTTTLEDFLHALAEPE